MKKGKRVMGFTIGIACFVLSYVMFMQFKVVKETDIVGIENLRESELREKLATWKDKYEEVNTKLEEVNAKLAEYKEKRETNQETSELLQKELSQAQMLAGLTDVKGNGVVITLKDNTQMEGGMVTAEALVRLINELRLAGAEAISINDQRIVTMSDIFEVESGSLLIDGKRIIAPYVVKVIGDQKYLESALTTKNVGYIETYSQNASIERQNNIKILKYVTSYKGINKIQTNYMKVKEEQK